MKRLCLTLALVVISSVSGYSQCTRLWFQDWSGGVNGQHVTNAMLNAGTVGLSSISWNYPEPSGGTPADHATFSSTYAHDWGGGFARPCANGRDPLPATVGYDVAIAETGKTSYAKLPITPNCSTACTFGGWFLATFPSTSSPNADWGVSYNVNLPPGSKFVDTNIIPHGGNGWGTGMETSGNISGVQCSTAHDGGLNAFVINDATPKWYFRTWRASVNSSIPDSYRLYAEGPNHTVGTFLGEIDSDLPTCGAGGPALDRFLLGNVQGSGSTDTGYDIVNGFIAGCIDDSVTACPWPFIPLNTLTFETAADGSGSAITSQTVASGSILVLYAVERTPTGTFVANVPVTWSGVFQGMVSGRDLVVAGDNKSATITGRNGGSLVLSAYDTDNVYATGTISVTKAASPVLRLPRS